MQQAICCCGTAVLACSRSPQVQQTYPALNSRSGHTGSPDRECACVVRAGGADGGGQGPPADDVRAAPAACGRPGRAAAVQVVTPMYKVVTL